MTGTSEIAVDGYRRENRPILAVSSGDMAYSGEQIKQARQRLRLKQGQLAELVGASERVVNRWENEGISDRAHYLGALEEVLQLGEYAHKEDPDDAAVNPTSLSDASLWATIYGLLAEAQRRHVTPPSVAGVPAAGPKAGPGRGEFGSLPEHLQTQQYGKRRQRDQ